MLQPLMEPSDSEGDMRPTVGRLSRETVDRRSAGKWADHGGSALPFGEVRVPPSEMAGYLGSRVSLSCGFTDHSALGDGGLPVGAALPLGQAAARGCGSGVRAELAGNPGAVAATRASCMRIQSRGSAGLFKKI